jgi:hypothetical protein
LLCLFLAVLIAALPTAPAQSAGLYTHSRFVERAIQVLSAQGGRYTELVGILNRHPATVNYGSVFPDISYLFDGAWAETAHDSASILDQKDSAGNLLKGNYHKYLDYLAARNYPDKYAIDVQTAYYKAFLADPRYGAVIPPFRAALMAALSDHFSNYPRTASDEKMIAFLFGVIAHQEADGPWHWNYNACDDRSAGGIGWGVECSAWRDRDYWDPLTREVQLDQYLFHYYGASAPDWNFLADVEADIVAVAGLPQKSLLCLLNNFDRPLWCGQANMRDLWNTATMDIMGANDGMKTFLETYVPGGVNYGAAMVAAAWMDTWDRAALPELPIGAFRSLQSHNYPDRYVRHIDWSIWVNPVTSDLGRRDATFRITTGLAGPPCVSFESLNYPGYFLRSRGSQQASLAPLEETPAFRAAATFCPRPGLADPNKLSFESLSHPGKYLRHQNLAVYTHYETTALFQADATFALVAPLGIQFSYLPLTGK